MNRLLHQQAVTRRYGLARRLGRRWRRPIRWIFGLGSLILLAGGLAWGVRWSPYFRLHKVEVVGSLHVLTVPQIEAAAGVAVGVPLFQIALSQVEKNVAALPWVASVWVRREIPDRLWIHVQEETPKALLLRDRLYYLSNQGKVFKPVEQEPQRNLPVVIGWPDSRSFDLALRLIDFFETESDFSLFGLSEIHYNEATGLGLVTLTGPMEIQLGEENIWEKLNRLPVLWPQVQAKWGRVRGVDLNYDDRALVKL